MRLRAQWSTPLAIVAVLMMGAAGAATATPCEQCTTWSALKCCYDDECKPTNCDCSCDKPAYVGWIGGGWIDGEGALLEGRYSVCYVDAAGCVVYMKSYGQGEVRDSDVVYDEDVANEYMATQVRVELSGIVLLEINI